MYYQLSGYYNIITILVYITRILYDIINYISIFISRHPGKPTHPSQNDLLWRPLHWRVHERLQKWRPWVEHNLLGFTKFSGIETAPKS